MTTVDEQHDGDRGTVLTVRTKGAPEKVLPQAHPLPTLGRRTAVDGRRACRRDLGHERLRGRRAARPGPRRPPTARRDTRPRPARGSRTRPVSARPGRHDRPSPPPGGGRDRPRPSGRHRRRQAARHHRRRTRPDLRTGTGSTPGLGRRSGLRSQHTGSQAPYRRRAARRGPGRRHDRGRCQRRPRTAPGRHRERHGPLRDRRRPGSLHGGAHRRRLHHRRLGHRGRPPFLRQRSQVHRLHLRPRRPRGRSLPGLRPLRRGDPAPRTSSPGRCSAAPLASSD